MEDNLTGQERKTGRRGKCDQNLRSSPRRLMLPEPEVGNEDSSSDSDERSLPDIKMEEDPLADAEDPLAYEEEQLSYGQVAGMCDEDTVTSHPTAKSKRPKKMLKIGFNKSYRSIDPTTGKYKCLVCSKEFSAAAGFYSHFNRVHLEIRFECDTCGKKFGRRTDYLRHNRSAHLSVRFKCSGCGKQFRRKSYLAEHQRRKGCLTKAGNMEMPTTSLTLSQTAGETNYNDSNHKLRDGKKQSNVNEELSNTDLRGVEDGSAAEDDEISEDLKVDPNQSGNTITPGTPVYKSKEPSTKSTQKSSTIFEGVSATGESITEGTKLASPPPPKVANILASSSSSKSTGVGLPVSRSSIDPVTGKHKCSRCSLEFETIPIFEIHYKSTHLKGRYECPLCGEDLPQTTESYLNHYKSVHMRAGGKSNICNETLSSKQRLKNQQQPHTKVEDLEDLDTGATEIKMEDDSADDEAPLANFVHEDLDDSDPLADEECQEPESKEVLNQKYSFDSTTGKYKCRLCPKEYSSFSGCLQHYKSVHLKIRYKCDLCEESFAWLPQYKLHKQNVHMGGRFKCTGCEKFFAVKKSLREHLPKCGCKREGEEDSDDRDYLADEEGHGSESKGRRHVPNQKYSFDSTTGKYKCRLCSKEYSSTSGCLQHHRSVHLKIRYKCDLCEESFAWLPQYNLHKQNVHMGGRFKCTGCEKSFSGKKSLQKHQQRGCCETNELGVGSTEIKIERDSATEEDSPDEDEQTSSQNQTITRRPGDNQLNQNVNVASFKFSGFEKLYTKKKSLRKHNLTTRTARGRDKRNNSKGKSQKNVGPPPPIILKNSSSSPRVELPIPPSHINPETGQPQLKCHLCSSEFSSKPNLREHILKDRYECVLCRAEFCILSMYQTHYRSVHMGVSHKFKCDICSEKFFTEYHLKKHKGSHTMQNKLPTRSMSLGPPQISMNPETGRFHCTLCPEDFEDKMSFHSHYLYKHKDYHFKCDICKKMFQTKSHLKRHQLLHNRDPAVEIPLVCLNPKTGRFHCTICPEDFEDKMGFQSHYFNKHKGYQFKCDICKKMFQKKNTFKRHQRLHRRDPAVEIPLVCLNPETGRFHCPICPKKFKDYEGFRLHHKAIHLQIRYDCSECDKRFVSKPYLKRHHQIVHLGIKIKTEHHLCDICGKSFSRKHNLKLHQRSGNCRSILGVKPSDFVCPDCGKGFFTEGQLNSHRDNFHSGVEFECEVCKKSFKLKDYLKAHQRKTSCGSALGLEVPRPSRTSNDQKHVCQECGKVYITKAGFNFHMQSAHLGVKFECEVCKNSYKRKLYLKEHQRSTSCGAAMGLEPQAHPSKICQLCGKEFTKTKNLRMHVRTVHEENHKHKCEHCDKSFALRRTLDRHVESTHLGIRYGCEVCKKSFTQKVLLASHHKWTSCGAALGMKPAPKQNCQVCGKEFNCRDLLRLHSKQNHPAAEKKIPCEGCDKFFLSPSHMRVHYNAVHLGVRKPTKPRRK